MGKFTLGILTSTNSHVEIFCWPEMVLGARWLVWLFFARIKDNWHLCLDLLGGDDMLFSMLPEMTRVCICGGKCSNSHRYTASVDKWENMKFLFNSIHVESNHCYSSTTTIRFDLRIQKTWRISINRIYFWFDFAHIPSRELTYPTFGKGKSSTQTCLFRGYVSFRECTYG